MAKPVIAANAPIEVKLQAGRTYLFCACGRSPGQPFCDGTHRQFSDDQVGQEGSGPG